MEWQRQAGFQAFVVAAASVVAIYFPFLPLRVFASVFGLYFVWTLWRNPRWFLQRLARFIVLATVPFLVAGVNSMVTGHVRLPEDRGELSFAFEQASAESFWAILGFAALCLCLDFLLTIFEQRRLDKVLSGSASKPTLFLKKNGEVTFSTDLLVEAPDGGSVAGASLFIGGLVPFSVDATIHLPEARPSLPQQPLRGVDEIPSKGKLLRLSGKVAGGWPERWMRLRAIRPWRILFPLRGYIVLSAIPQGLRVPIPLTFKVSWPPNEA